MAKAPSITADDIARRLLAKYPDLNPLSVTVPELRSYMSELDAPIELPLSDDNWIEQVQIAWLEEIA